MNPSDEYSDHFSEIYVAGKWTPSTSSSRIAVVNPASEEVIAEIPDGSTEDVDLAVAAARDSFEPWADVPPSSRGKLLALAAELLAERAGDIANLISDEVGTPRKVAAVSQVRGARETLAGYAALAGEFRWEESVDGAQVVHAPVGVVAAITPWNFPLGLAVDKVAPALAAGCSVILKPSELAPLSAWVLTHIFHEVGLPPGVFNMLSGTGATVGESLVSNPGVDMISFTGSTRTGKHIAELAARRVARVVLELGGKSANLILDDADLDTALPASIRACFSNSGQVCVALSRLLVPAHMRDDVVERASAIVAKIKVGDPHEDVDLGPLVSEAQRGRVRSYIERGVAEGATLVAGGPEPPAGLSKGYFVQPTVFADVDNSMTIAREEIFGPVLSIITYDNEDEAAHIANDSPYGLSGGVWSSDPSRAAQLARRLRTGVVRVNGAPLGRNAPFGGFKESGIGRARGRFGLEEYTELQAITGTGV